MWHILFQEHAFMKHLQYPTATKQYFTRLISSHPQITIQHTGLNTCKPTYPPDPYPETAQPFMTSTAPYLISIFAPVSWPNLEVQAHHRDLCRPPSPNVLGLYHIMMPLSARTNPPTTYLNLPLQDKWRKFPPYTYIPCKEYIAYTIGHVLCLRAF